jgi:hypothetical protein
MTNSVRTRRFRTSCVLGAALISVSCAAAVPITPPLAGSDSLNHRDLLVEATFDARPGRGLQHVTRMESWEWMARSRLEDIPEIDLKLRKR